VYGVEALVFIYVAGTCWAVARSGAVGNALRLVVLLGALAAGAAAFRLVGPLVGAATANFFLRTGLQALAGFAGFCLAHGLLARLLRLRARHLAWQAGAPQGRMLPRWLDGLVVAGFLAVYLAAVLLVLELLVNLAGMTAAREQIAHHSLFLKLFLRGGRVHVTRQAPVDADGDDLARQDRFLIGLQRALAGAGRYLAEKAGTETVLRNMAALKDIAGSSNEQKRRILETSPDLRDLLDKPAVRAVAQSPRVRELIDRVAGGSTEAVLELARDPDVNALMEDADVRRTMKQIDLLAIQRRLREEQKPAERHPAP